MTAPATLTLDTTRPLAIAVMAMGGQGGGVLVDWIVALCEAQGWAAQSTSVPGVAQRTGATVYYIETLPLPADAPPGLRPVFSLMAGSGDVDAAIGAEWMEAGRAMLRGLVTPDRTTLIASTHRSLAVVEKQTPGDGIANSEVVGDACERQARHRVRHGAGGGRSWQRPLCGAVRRAGRGRNSAVSARCLRSDHSRGGHRRHGQPARLCTRL
jgi:indolepyruvate ferredoxin oxidoreductase beta subunit